MTHSSPNAIIAGVSAANYNDILAFGVDIVSILMFGIQ